MNRRSADSPSETSHPKKLQKQMHVNNETHLEINVLSSQSDSISDNRLIPKLPIEVVNHLFGFLSLGEKLNASLVCKEWHEAASFRFYSCNEKLVFHGFQNFEELLLFLLKTRRKILNLEFRNCELHSSSHLLLMAAKIHYLSFVNCQLDSDLAIELFAECVNLNEFYYNDVKIINYSPSILTCFRRQFMEKLEEMHVVNKNLKTLSLSTVRTDMTSHNIRSIFKIFPHIEHLTFKVSDLSYYKNDNLSPDEFSFAVVIQEIISLKNSLKYLKINALEPQLRSLVLHDFTRLKEISISMPSDIPDSLIFDFFSRQQYLERISCSSVLGFSFPTRFFEYLIHHCSYLKHLKLKFRVSTFIDLSPEMFRTLVSSNLISLTILNSNIKPSSDQLFTTSRNSLANTTLRILRIPVIIDHRMQSLFVRTFKNLMFLELQCFSGTVLESIGQFQKNLTTLKLSLLGYMHSNMSKRFISPASKWSMHEAKNCLKSLACLENLDLNFDGSTPLFEFKFVPLSVKHLRVCVFAYDIINLSADRLSILALKEKTGLEAIYFDLPDVRVNNLNIWMEICRSLNKLCFLGLRSGLLYTPVTNPPELHLQTHQTLCDRCPSLRFSAQVTGRGHSLFGYDHVYRKMKEVTWHTLLTMYRDFIVIEKISGLKIKFYLTSSPNFEKNPVVMNLKLL